MTEEDTIDIKAANIYQSGSTTDLKITVNVTCELTGSPRWASIMASVVNAQLGDEKAT